MDIKEQIGKRITQTRKALNLTIKELSEQLNHELSAARISNWEQGTRSPGPTEAKLLASKLDVSASYLLCLTDHPGGEISLNKMNSIRYVPILSMKEALHAKELIKSEQNQPLLFDKHEKAIIVDNLNRSLQEDCLFAITVEDASMTPLFNPGDLVIINVDRSAQPGDLVLAHLPSKKQTILRQYSESKDHLYQLLANNELWATINVQSHDDVILCSVVCEHRRYF